MILRTWGHRQGWGACAGRRIMAGKQVTHASGRGELCLLNGPHHMAREPSNRRNSPLPDASKGGRGDYSSWALLILMRCLP